MVRPSLVTTLVVALLAILGFMAVALTQRARSQRTTAATPPAAPVQVPTSELKPLPAPKRVSYSVLRVRGNLKLRSKPGGKVLASVGSTTQFGSPTTLTVAAQKAGWVG